MKKALYFLVFLVLTLSFTPVLSAKNIEIKENPNNYQVTIPAGSLFEALFMYQISSEYNNVGDGVELIMPSALKYGDLTLIEKDTKFVGKIIKLQRAIIGQNGYVQILFDEIVFPDGKSGKILAHVWTKENTGIIGGDLTQHTKYKKMPHYIQGIGGVAQLIPVGPRVMGTETYILSGAQFRLVLDEDLSLVLPKE